MALQTLRAADPPRWQHTGVGLAAARSVPRPPPISCPLWGAPVSCRFGDDSLAAGIAGRGIA